MSRLLAADVLPLHAQVSLLDSTWQGYPEWSDLATAAAEGDGGIAVGTAPDVSSDGTIPVRVEVWIGDVPDLSMAARAYNGILMVGHHGIRVGNEEACDVHTLPVEYGVYWLEAWVEPTSEPRRVVFLLDRKGSRRGGGVYVRARAVEWVSDEPIPGLVKVEVVDSDGRISTIIDKAAVVDELGVLTRRVDYPVRIWLACTVSERSGEGAPGTVAISTAQWDIETVEGVSEFRVRRELLMRQGSATSAQD